MSVPKTGERTCRAPRRLAIPLAVLLSFPPAACGGGSSSGVPQGFGSDTPGGSGQPVYHVTSLADGGPGSLREAVSKGGRMVVFDVAGTIAVGGSIPVKGSFVTIDGTSAPSPGITLRGGGLRLNGRRTNDVIIRGLRIRDPAPDGITVKQGAQRILIDHVSVDGCRDGNVDITRGSHDVTVSWSILSGCAKNSLVKYGAVRVSFYRNVFVNSQWRNPWLNNVDDGHLAGDTTADVRNNLIWGWGDQGGGTGAECGAKVNLVGNYYSSPRTRPDRQAQAIVLSGCERGQPALIHTAGNVSADHLPFDLNSLGNAPAPFFAPPAFTEDACAAASSALASAGAHPRDAIDSQHLASIRLACN